MKNPNVAQPATPETSTNTPQQPAVDPAIRNYTIRTYTKIITTLGEGASPRAIEIMATFLTDYMPYSWSHFEKELKFLRECAQILAQSTWYGMPVDEETQIKIVQWAIAHRDDRQNAQSRNGASFLGRLAESLRNAHEENIYPHMI